MRTFRFGLVLFSLIVVGCGGGGSGPSQTAPIGGPAQAVAAGEQALNQAFANVNRSANLTTAMNDFSLAIREGSTDPKANAGYAIAASAQIANNLGTLLGSSSLPSNSLTLTALKGMNLTTGFVLPSPKPNVADLLPKALRPTSLSVTSEQLIQAAIRDAIPTLVQIKASLTTPSIAAFETKPWVIAYGGTSYKIGAGELYALRASLEATIATCDLSVAYNLEDGGFNWTQNFYSKFSVQVISGAAIPETSFVPQGTFGTLATGGAANFTDLGVELKGAANDVVSGAKIIVARTTTGWLANFFGLTNTTLVQYEADGNELLSALNGPVNLSVNGTNVSMNLPAWITKPPANLKPFIPSIKAVNYDGLFRLERVSGSIADLTFGGLFPAKVSASVIYNGPGLLVTGIPVYQAGEFSAIGWLSAPPALYPGYSPWQGSYAGTYIAKNTVVTNGNVKTATSDQYGNFSATLLRTGTTTTLATVSGSLVQTGYNSNGSYGVFIGSFTPLGGTATAISAGVVESVWTGTTTDVLVYFTEGLTNFKLTLTYPSSGTARSATGTTGNVIGKAY